MGSNPGGRLVDATTCCGLTAAISMATFRKLARMDVAAEPVVFVVTPAEVPVGGTGLTITVFGDGFEASDFIYIDGVGQTTGFGAGQLVAINVVASSTPNHVHQVEVKTTGGAIKGTGEFRTAAA